MKHIDATTPIIENQVKLDYAYAHYYYAALVADATPMQQHDWEYNLHHLRVEQEKTNILS